MSAENREKLLTKIQALLAKADVGRGATEEEAKVFLAKAQELMTRHGVEEMELEDLLAKKAEDLVVEEDRLDRAVRRRIADGYVCEILQKCFGVRVLFGKHYPRPGGPAKQRYFLVGDPTDIALAKMAIPMIHRSMVSGLGLYLKAEGKKWTSVAEHSFCAGLASGYITASEQGRAKAEAQMNKKQKANYGIILANKQQAITLYMDNKYPNLKSAFRGRQNDSVDRIAYLKGHQAGKSMDLDNKNKLK